MSAFKGKASGQDFCIAECLLLTESQACNDSPHRVVPVMECLQIQRDLFPISLALALLLSHGDGWLAYANSSWSE